MNFTHFEDLQREVFRLHAEQAYALAMALIAANENQFPDKAHRLMFWQACFHNLLGKQERALAILEQALARGFWYGEDQLRRDPDLASLQGVPAFERLVATCQTRQFDAQKSARPQRIVIAPHSISGNHIPVVFALHGSNTSAVEHVDNWRLAAELGWLVAALQSSYVSGIDTYNWRDGEQVVTDIQFHLAELKQQYKIGANRIVIGGFSRGGEMAVELAVTQRIPVRGCIGVCASIHDDASYWHTLHGSQDDLKARMYFIAGDQDVRFYQPTLRLGEFLDGLGIPNRIKVYPGMGHVYPPDFGQALEQGLEFIASD